MGTSALVAPVKVSDPGDEGLHPVPFGLPDGHIGRLAAVLSLVSQTHGSSLVSPAHATQGRGRRVTRPWSPGNSRRVELVAITKIMYYKACRSKIASTTNLGGNDDHHHHHAAALTRDHKGTVVPAPGVYDIDAKHTSVEFVARHLMITKVRGRFDDVEGTITVADVPEESSVQVTIGAASVRTGEDQRDAHLRSGDFFDVDTHPHWTFTSTAVEQDGDQWKVTGDLTISGVTKPVVLDVEFDGRQHHPVGDDGSRFLGLHRDRP